MIQEWLEATLGDIIEAGGGTELRVNCPFCESRVGRPDEKHHLYISTQSPVAMCHRCTWQGSYISLVIGVSGCSYAEALRQLDSPMPSVERFSRLMSPTGLLGSIPEAVISKPNKFKTFDINENSAKEELAVWNYLVNRRKIPQALIRKYMGWAPGTHRAWILVDCNFWQGRLIIPGEPKYLSSPWPKGDALWNANALNDNHVIICEGVFSAIAVGSHAIALCGKTITPMQAERIVRSHVRAVTIMLDADAIQQAYGIAKTLEEVGYVGIMKIHELVAGDPTDGLEGKLVTYDWHANIDRVLLAV